MANHQKKSFGFTLVELIMVIVLLSIVSAVALPRFFGRSEFDQRALFDDTLNALRYAQKLAVATNCQTQFQSTVTRYDVFRDNGCTSGTFTIPVRHPTTGELGLTGEQAGVSLTAATITFFPLGNATFLPPGNTTITIGSRTLVVVADTGFIFEQ